LGYEALQGVKLAIAQWNAQDGPGSYMIELVALNDANDPNEARLQARELSVDPAVLGVVAGWNTETAEAIVPVLQQEGLATVLSWSVPHGLADLGHGTALIAANEEQVAEVLVRYLSDTVSCHNIVVVGDERVVAPYLSLFPDCARGVFPPESQGREELRSWVTTLLQEGPSPPETLILAADAVQAGEIVRAVRQSFWPGLLVGAARTGSTLLLDIAGREAHGMAIVSPAPAGSDLPPHFRETVNSLAALSPRALLAYDAAQVLLRAIDINVAEEGIPSREGLIRALPRVRVKGLTGTITFGPDGQRSHPAIWLYRIEDDRYPGTPIRQISIPSTSESGER